MSKFSPAQVDRAARFVCELALCVASQKGWEASLGYNYLAHCGLSTQHAIDDLDAELADNFDFDEFFSEAEKIFVADEILRLVLQREGEGKLVWADSLDAQTVTDLVSRGLLQWHGACLGATGTTYNAVY